MGILKKPFLKGSNALKKSTKMEQNKSLKPKPTLKEKIINSEIYKYQILLFNRVPKRIQSVNVNNHNCKLLYFKNFAVIENFSLTKNKTKFDFKSFKEMMKLSLKNIKNYNLVAESKIDKIKFTTWIFFNHPEIKKSVNISKSYNEKKFAMFIKENKIQKIKNLDYNLHNGQLIITLVVKINNKLTKIIVPKDTLPHYEIKI